MKDLTSENAMEFIKDAATFFDEVIGTIRIILASNCTDEEKITGINIALEIYKKTLGEINTMLFDEVYKDKITGLM